ncbi:hypothetical protein [Endozoicomonas lisbonensis]|uniref:hypothetical protein n=1 Tax=Endozoicomonas lisbonensis TaxID=3120522 RepID=UPI003397B240
MTFYIGSIAFPPVNAEATVTPLDIAQAADPGNQNVKTDHPVSVNILRVLQSLDLDGNPETGIRIPATAAQFANQLLSSGIDFTDQNLDLDAQGSILDFVREVSGDSSKTIKPEGEALRHFKEQLATKDKPDYTGAWLLDSSQDKVSLLIFIEQESGSGIYYQAEFNEPDNNNGIEYGSYTYQPDTGQLTFINEVDTNGPAGINDESVRDSNHRLLNIQILNNKNVLAINRASYNPLTGTIESEESAFSRIKSVYEELYGVWRPEPSEGNDSVFVFAEDGRYYGIQSKEPNNQIGGEYGTFDLSESKLTFKIEQDHSGESLLSAVEQAESSATVEGNTLQITFSEGSESATVNLSRQ